ncbi:MAG: FAD-binding protein, partial [Lachnospiraceae bacterium]|nr:FAD-binding protein [Lachnospiraceae bacterium]
PKQYEIPKVLTTEDQAVAARTCPVTEGENRTARPRPVIVGAGPAGLFAAYALAQAGLCPLLIERGEPADRRAAAVETFFSSGKLLKDSNVLFGEGGAGTFSDGKLNTSVKDKTGRHRFVLETFVRFGADPSLVYEARPHIGTDKLLVVIPAIRKAIEEAGGAVLFDTRLEKLILENGKIAGITVSTAQPSSDIPDRPFGTKDGSLEAAVCVRRDRDILCDTLILATGHSARDTFLTLYEQGVPMQAKEFAVGFRVEHPQERINAAQYGPGLAGVLPAAPYKLVAKHLDRPVYSFCMCPGGYVVNASSEEGMTCVNGMSYAARDSGNANSAIVVAVGAKEYDLNDPMAAIAWQRKLERAVFERGGGAIVQQLFGDFTARRASTTYGGFASKTKGAAVLGDLRGILSEEAEEAFIDGMHAFDAQIAGFCDPETILSGIESRTSSPIRILRNDTCESTITGLYPCGEGAGYAGGIASAAMDGLRVAEAVIDKVNNR